VALDQFSHLAAQLAAAGVGAWAVAVAQGGGLGVARFSGEFVCHRVDLLLQVARSSQAR
jgi:hypothetical protein